MSDHVHNAAAAHAGRGDSHGGLAHVMEPRILLGVWAALMVLTVITVAVVQVDLGPLSLWVAMGIATIKASLVALYFMHLRYDKPLNAIILISALLFVTLFIGLSMMDTLQYRPDINPDWISSPPQTK